MRANSQVTIPKKDRKMIRILPDMHKELNKLVERKGEKHNSIIKRVIKSIRTESKKSKIADSY